MSSRERLEDMITTSKKRIKETKRTIGASLDALEETKVRHERPVDESEE